MPLTHKGKNNNVHWNHIRNNPFNNNELNIGSTYELEVVDEPIKKTGLFSYEITQYSNDPGWSYFQPNQFPNIPDGVCSFTSKLVDAPSTIAHCLVHKVGNHFKNMIVTHDTLILELSIYPDGDVTYIECYNNGASDGDITHKLTNLSG